MMRRTHLQQGSAELDEVREAIGLRPAGLAVIGLYEGEPALGAPGSGQDVGRRVRYPAGSLSGRARRSPPKTPITATSARRSRPGPGQARTRSCSRPSRRSAPQPGYWNAP